jgi:hypothetical protein
MTTPPLSPILDHKDTARLQTSSDDPSTPSQQSATRLFQRNCLGPLTSAIHQTVAMALFLEPILLLINKSTPEPYHNDTAANKPIPPYPHHPLPLPAVVSCLQLFGWSVVDRVLCMIFIPPFSLRQYDV